MKGRKHEVEVKVFKGKNLCGWIESHVEERERNRKVKPMNLLSGTVCGTEIP